ncbi:MAG: adenine deaminase C-terminal domain-containing protein [Slackia sp.]
MDDRHRSHRTRNHAAVFRHSCRGCARQCARGQFGARARRGNGKRPVDDRETRRTVPLRNGLLESDPDQDVLKAFVFERHHETGTHGCGFVSGFGITGALAQTVAHDAHNLLVVGSNNEDMALAANTLIECGGGAVAVRDGKVLGLVKLPIAGLMSDKPLEEVALEVDGLEQAWEDMGCTMVSPFMTMALLSPGLHTGAPPDEQGARRLLEIRVRSPGGGRVVSAGATPGALHDLCLTFSTNFETILMNGLRSTNQE